MNTELEHVCARFETFLLTEKRVAQNTFLAYKRDIEQLKAFLAKRKKSDVCAVSEIDLKQFLAELKRNNVTARSAARKICSIRALFGYLHDKFDIPNVSQGLISPKLEKTLPRVLSEKDVQALLDRADQDQSIPGKRNKVMIYLLYASGMRITELVMLKINDIHFDTGFVQVLGKGNKTRMIPLPQAVITLLTEYVDAVHVHVRKKMATDYLFPVVYSKKVKHLTRQAFWGILKRLALGLDLEMVSPHQLRHSLATHLLKNGADLRSLQLLLGHESMSTVQLYTHVDTSHMRRIYDDKHPRSR